VESVEVIGYRRLTKADISVHIKTRSGQRFSNERIGRDLEAILATNLFDKKRTRVTTEPGLRGGAVVIFEVVEMPLLSAVSFKGLRAIKASQIFDALRKKGISLEKNTVYDPVKVGAAERIIQDLLALNGYPDAIVTEIGERTGTYVSITFEVAYKE
jgi:outer membrane protein assembly factor BamA